MKNLEDRLQRELRKRDSKEKKKKQRPGNKRIKI